MLDNPSIFCFTHLKSWKGDVSVYLMSYSEATLQGIWKKAATECPAIPGFDFYSGPQYFESVQKVNYFDYRLVVFRGIISKLEIFGDYFKFETKYGGTLLFQVGYIHHGTISFENDRPCEIIYYGGIIRVNHLEYPLKA